MEQDQTPYPFSLRLTFEERAQLEQDAADIPLGEYIRRQALGGKYRRRRRTRNKRPVKDQKALAELLVLLGNSHLSSNINQLAKAANMGTVIFEPETERALRHAASDIHEMRSLLIKGLGLEDRR